MPRNLLFACGLGLAALSLAACDEERGMAANHGMCFNFKAAHPAPAAATPAVAPAAPGAAQPAAAAGDPGAVVDDCVRRWAYSLAASSDTARDVADAAQGACMDALARWNEQSLTQAGGPAQAPSIATGQPTNALAEHYNYARSRALLYVVQARAGRCAPPPAKNGAPQGTLG
jgi:hypothetical protein